MSVYNFTDKPVWDGRTTYPPDHQGRVFRVDREYGSPYESALKVFCVHAPTYVYHPEGDAKGFRVEAGSVVILDEAASQYVELNLRVMDWEGYLNRTFGHASVVILTHTSGGLLALYEPVLCDFDSTPRGQ